LLQRKLEVSLIRSNHNLHPQHDLVPWTRPAKDVEVLESHQLVHLQFLAWPDNGVPQVNNFLSAFKYYEDLRKDLYANVDLSANSLSPTPSSPASFDSPFQTPSHSPSQSMLPTPTVPPIIIHCSAGIGRSGTWLAVDHIVQMLKRRGDSSIFGLPSSKGIYQIDVFDLLLYLRTYRRKAVQTKAQYTFIFTFIDTILRNKALDLSPPLAIPARTDSLFHEQIEAEFPTGEQ
jgi:protein tyrosine phosphatase